MPKAATPKDDIIEKLGGVRKLASDLGTTPGAVSNWRLRATIPWKYKPAIARLAGERAIPLPANFWDGVAA